MDSANAQYIMMRIGWTCNSLVVRMKAPKRAATTELDSVRARNQPEFSN